MENKIKRPISVWIAQILFVFYVLLMVLAFFLALMTTQQSERSFMGILFVAITDVFLIVLFVTAFWGMSIRKSYGRWLGVGMLSFMVIFAPVGDVLFPGTFTKPMITKVLEILFSIFVFVVTLNIALSDKVEAFFAGKVHAPSLDNPSPSSFDT